MKRFYVGLMSLAHEPELNFYVEIHAHTEDEARLATEAMYPSLVVYDVTDDLTKAL